MKLSDFEGSWLALEIDERDADVPLFVSGVGLKIGAGWQLYSGGEADYKAEIRKPVPRLASS